MIKTFEYRLYPNRRQRRLLIACLAESRRLYNEMLQTVKEHHEQTAKFLFKGSVCDHVPATTVQALADRLDKALRHLITRKKCGEYARLPRFKGPNRWHTIQLRQWGKDASLREGRLKVPAKLGKSIKLKQHRPLEGEPKTAHLKIARQRKDFLHKVARKYAENYSTIVVEDLNVADMIKNHHLASSIHDAGWSKFIEILEYKAESAGARVVKVPARFTTQECHVLVPKPLSVRIHLCPQCGYAEDRDVNAAKNILLAWTGPSACNVTGCCERAPKSRPL